MHDAAKVIVMGCSLGGFAALSEVLAPIPKNYPYPIIVVQHRLKYEKSTLEEVLQTKLKLKVKQADEKEEVRGSIVYVAPPDYHLLLETNLTLSLSSDEAINFSRPSIDVLFESASEACKENLVGILLSGANSDGERGITKIWQNKGITIAQDPQEALCRYMPEAAIKTGHVQKILKNSEITHFLLAL